MKKAIIGIALLSLFVFLSPDIDAAGGWKLIKNSSGIKVYERDVPGTDLKEYMGVGTIDAKIEVIGELLRDVPRWKNWLSDCYGAQVEKKYDRNTMVIYLVLNPPVIEQRDIVLKDRVVYDWNNGKAHISFNVTNEVKIPVEKNRVRVKLLDGLFDLEYLGRDKTKCIYKLKVDPGGSIPKKVAYAVMKNYPYDTLKGIRKSIKDSKYAKMAKGTYEEKQIQSKVANMGFVRTVLTKRLSKFAKNKAVFNAVIAADKTNINNIMKSGGSYSSVEKATTDFFIKYFEKTVGNKDLVKKFRNNKKLIAEITSLVTTDCGAYYQTVDNIVKKYIE